MALKRLGKSEAYFLKKYGITEKDLDAYAGNMATANVCRMIEAAINAIHNEALAVDLKKEVEEPAPRPRSTFSTPEPF
jgi:hypothetical protein